VKIRSKIILVVLPLIIVTVILAETASLFSAVNGVNRIAWQFLSFKASELQKYAESQWNLLEEYGYAQRPEMLNAAKSSVEIYAKSIVLSDTERIFAIDEAGNVVMQSAPIVLEAGEAEHLISSIKKTDSGSADEIATMRLGGDERSFMGFYFEPFGWYVALSELNVIFYQDAYEIAFQTIIVLLFAIAIPILLLALFANRLTKPLTRVIGAMNNIITSGKLDERVSVEYRDETGRLAHTFNLMTAALQKAYAQIKQHAFNEALAHSEEQRIREIFQKYVPKDVIDQFFASPEKMLVGQNRKLAVLFSDIRSFTSISEGLAPDELVQNLNRYFSTQVDVIMNRKGVVDKYIGDAIMAFWGAPVHHEDDALQAVLAGLDMEEALVAFNAEQIAAGKPEFHIGIGINFGEVTVGNIGSEKKMDYTVIGDPVNLASRMEGLTKIYKEGFLITDMVVAEIVRLQKAGNSQAKLPMRLLDMVAVKNRKEGVRIYAVKRSLSANEAKALTLHNEAMGLYYGRKFSDAGLKFQAVLQILPGDLAAGEMLARCNRYAKTPPPINWDGVEVMTSK
jgi:class 3 adenylate cyclase/HAMP domain-containing protein